LQNSKLDQDQPEIANQRELLQEDRDIREWMRLRDLYIVAVHHVGGNGQVDKTYGRVSYTKGKSLIFYANELDHQAGPKNATTFQAGEPPHIVVRGDRARSPYGREECRQ
jgi:hypothetical protein